MIVNLVCSLLNGKYKSTIRKAHMKEIVRSHFKVKLVETEEELYKVRKLRYEELILGHRDRAQSLSKNRTPTRIAIAIILL